MATTRRGGSRSRLTFGLLVLTSVTLLTLDARGFAPIESVRSAVLGFFAPVGETAGNVFRPVGDAWDGARQQGSLREENETLRERVAELEGDLADAEAAERELTQLQAQLELGFVEDVGEVHARVVTGSVGNFEQTVELDKGSDDGIRAGMPVVSGRGLVGQVAQVSGSRAVVRLLTDPGYQAGVKVPGTSGLGVVTGRGEGRLLRASFDLRTDVEPGDLVVTSGAERSLYPPDVPVGRIRAVDADEVNLSRDATVEPLVAMDELLYVTVLLWEQRG
ncbi:MAG: rod shape-determining protein MreC [Acidimicrobiia bacterium]|nr:rod shape-determining protein MreC [Acidimicrobiia bacterium]